MRGERKSWVAFSCMHSPFFSERHLDSLIDICRQEKPDYIICLGDVFEAASASVHPNEVDHDLLSEFNNAAVYFNAVRRSCGREVRPVWLLGNHDANILHPDSRRVDRQLRRCCEWNRHSEEFPMWQQVPYVKSARGVFQLGPVVFYHGYDAGVNSDELESLQFNNYTGGHAHRLFVRGHTHRPRDITVVERTKTIQLPWEYCNVGTMCDIDQMVYMRRKDTSRWGAAVSIGNTEVGRSCFPEKKYESEIIMLDGA